jgi:centromere/kinetochore protein ZW10
LKKPSFVVAYVPSWLKFSYLSELLVGTHLTFELPDVHRLLQEASMADISYLFEEGALVDFDVEELARLVRALFADTPLRATTINKLLGGHPILMQ